MGTVSIDDIKIDANAPKLRSVRYDRAKQLRAKVADDIAAPLAQAETEDIETDDPQSLPGDLARREALRAKLDAAYARMEADARAEADAARKSTRQCRLSTTADRPTRTPTQAA